MASPARLRHALTHLHRAQSLQTAPFTYPLPPHRIATRPLPARHTAKLLAIRRQTFSPSHHVFADLPTLLPSDSLIIRNATRVIPARLPVFKHTGGRAEVLLLHPHSGPIEQALSLPAAGQTWAVLLGGRNLAVGDTLCTSKDCSLQLCATVNQRGADARVSFSTPTSHSLREIIDTVGAAPLPPYIRRAADSSDRSAFQTVFAREEGSVAAPTAALHVTDNVLQALRMRGVAVHDVVLHIGTATFRQVKSDVAGGHAMHSETIAIPASTVAALVSQLAASRPVVALGTTSVRTIESLYWFGVRLLVEPQASPPERLSVGQWEPYIRMDECGEDGVPTPAEALRAALDWCDDSDGVIHGETHLLIVPGYRFMITNALVTNFHQPQSTLLMLVSAFYGGAPDRLREVYEHALNHDYRFLSYGDSSIYADDSFFARNSMTKSKG